jgi:hypothetical protein
MLLTDRTATILSVLKVVYFLRTVWSIFLHPHTQPDPKQSIKKFLGHIHHVPTTPVPSLTLLSDFPFPGDQTSRIANIANDKRIIQTWDVQGCSGRSQIFVRLVMVREY